MKNFFKKIFKYIAKLNETRVGFIMMVLVFMVYFANFSFIETLSLKLYDLNFILRGPIETEKDVVIVAIDQKSQEKLGRYPWTRIVIANLIDRLSGFGARVIGLDIVYSYPEKRPDLELANKLIIRLKERPGSDPDLLNELQEAARNADVDTRLAESFKRAGNVVGGYFFFTRPEEIEDLKLDSKADYRIIRRSKFPSYKLPKGEDGKVIRDFKLIQAVGAKPNIKILTKAAKTTGYFTINPDSDGAVRKILNIIEFNKKYFPSLAFQTLRTYYEDRKAKVIFEEYGVKGFELGPHFIPSDEHGQTYINYYGGEGQFPVIPVSDVLKGGDIPDEELSRLIKDKIVLVGATATGIYDRRITPFGVVPGVDTHASFIQNVLDERVLKKSGWFFIFDALSIFIITFILILILKRVGALYGSLSAVLLVFSYFYVQRYFFIQQNTILDIFYPLLTIVLVYGGIVLYRYSSETREKKFIRGAFAQYLSPAVIQNLVKDPSKLTLGGERKNLTAFFSDVAGFSTISEKLSPEDLVQLLNDYLTAMTEIILEHGGTVDKYEGDAIIAFFGAPVEQSDHAKRTCLAAIDMQKKLADMRKELLEQGKAELKARIGINSGPMVVGNMGSKTRMDYTIMGDSVNLASRLEGANKAYGSETMISEMTYELCKEDVEVRELDTIQVVGKKEAVKVYELLSRKGELDPDKEKVIDFYQKGLACYKERKWDEAIKFFGNALDIQVNDAPSMTYMERCVEYQQNPPDESWSGVHVLESK